MEQDACQKADSREARIFQFKIEEYKSLRKEIDVRVKEAFSLIIYCLTAIFASYGAFMAGEPSTPTAMNGHPGLRHLALYVAAFFPVFGLVKSREAWGNILRIAEHIRTLEADFGLESWEHKAQRYRDRNFASWPAMFSQPPYTLFWIALIAATVFVALEGLIGKI